MSKKSDDTEAEKEKYSEEQLKKFYEKLKTDQGKELAKLQGKVKGQKFQELETLMRDKSTLKQEDFEKQKDDDESQRKIAGVSAGYVTRELASGDTFMLKHFYKDPNKVRREEDYSDRMDAVNELMGSTMYQRLLYNRTPREGLVKGDKDHPHSLYVRSKFFKGAKQLAEYSTGVAGFGVDPNDRNLSNVKGLERVIAACHILGEGDYHAGNLMVRSDGRVVKIDHGKSFMTYPQDFGDMIAKTYDVFGNENVKVCDAIEKGNMKFNVGKYKKALDRMTKQLSSDEIENIVNQKMAELANNGFKLSVAEFNAKKYSELAERFRGEIEQNLKNMKEISNQLDVITKFGENPPAHGFKEGGWLREFAKSDIKDPVVYAIEKGIKIDGMDAIQWAHENGYRMKSPTDPDKTMDSMEYIAKLVEAYGPKGSKYAPESVVKYMSEAASLGLKTSDGKPFSELLETVVGYAEDKTVTREIERRNEEVADKVMPSIDEFTKKSVGKSVTSKDVENFYEGLMTTLKKEGYVTDKDIDTIKSNPGYKANIENTKNLLNSNDISKLPRGDKLCYKVAGFCKSLGLAKLSDHFMKKISPKSLEKIHETEKIIAKTLQIQESLLGKSGVQQSLGAKKIELTEKVVQNKLNARAKKHEPAKKGR